MVGIERAERTQRDQNQNERGGHHSDVRPNARLTRIALVVGHFERRWFLRRAAVVGRRRRASPGFMWRSRRRAGNVNGCFFGIAECINPLTKLDWYISRLAKHDRENL